MDDAAGFRRGAPARESLRTLLKTLAVGLAVCALAWISITATTAHGRVAAIWPANAVVLAALFRAPSRRWAALLASGFVGNFTANLLIGDATLVGLAMSAINTAEILVNALALRALVGPAFDLTRTRHLVTFAAVAIASSCASALAAAGMLGALNHEAFARTFIVWVLADALGLMIVTPALLALTPEACARFLAPSVRWRNLGLLALVLATTTVVFAQPQLQVRFLVFAALVMLSFETDMVGAALGVLSAGLIAVTLSALGHGPSPLSSAAVETAALVLQVFLLTCLATSLPVAAAMARRRQLEGDLARTAHDYKLLADHSSDVIMRIAPDRTILYVSPSCVRYGYRQGALIGRSIVEITHPDDLADLTAQVAAPAAGAVLDIAFNGERRLLTADGTWVWMDGRPEIVRDADGRMVEIVTQLRDISARKAAEDALAESEARLRFIHDHSPDIVIRVDRDDHIHYVSPSCRRYGYEPEDLIGRPGFDLVHPDDLPRVQALIAALFSGASEDRAADREQRIRLKDGSYTWMEGNPSIVRDEAGLPVEVISVLRDITARKQAEAALVESEAKFRLLAENATDVIASCTPDGTIIYVSPAAERVFGYTPDELVGTGTFHLIHPDDRAMVSERMIAFMKAREPGAVTRIEYRALTKAGETIWIEANPSLTLDPASGRVVALNDFSRDITERKRTEAAMAESEARYRLVTENSHDVVFQFDTDGTITFVSGAARLFGYEPEELVGTNGFVLMHPDDVQSMNHVLAGLLNGSTSGSADAVSEFRVRTKAGAYAWVEGNPSAAFSDDGSLVGFVNSLRDVSKRKAAEEALEESEARYELLASSTTGAVIKFAANGQILYVSPSVRRFGYEPGDLTGRAASEFIHPEDRAKVGGLIANLFAGDADPHTDRTYRFKDGGGNWVWVEGNPTLISDADGHVVAVSTWLRDISDRRASEIALAQSEERYRLLTENARDMIMEFRPDGRIDYVSGSCFELTGYTAAEVIGRPALPWVHEDDQHLILDAFQDQIAARDPVSPKRIVYRILHKGGAAIWMESSPTALRHPTTGELVCVTDVVRDVTAHKTLQESLSLAGAAAEASAKAKSDFLANMSHEIRTPLTGILGFAGLLKDVDGLPPRAERFADRINTAGQTLLAVVNDILDFSKIEAGQIELDPVPFAPEAFIAETVELVAEQARIKGLALEVEPCGPLPPVVEADSSRLRQILLNLLTNALKFTDKGAVRVGFSYQPGSGALRVAVTDTGVGIAPDKAGDLFERFSQADGSVSRRYGGTGLGLAISKSLAELMGGSIGVESEPGKGSTFWFTIAAPQAQAAPELDADGPEQDHLSAPARILIVDDVDMNRELVGTLLRVFGHHLAEAASGAEAVEAAITSPFDLILMDLQMPGMDGFAATRAIRDNSEINRQTPIVALSANVLANHLEACQAAGMDDHIAKPIDAGDLLGKVAHWTTASAPRAPASVGP